MDKPKRLVLNHEERVSSVWKKLTSHLEQRLQSLRSQIEKDLDVVETAKARGRIAEIRAVLRLAEDPPNTD
jgi:hypothetical protein